MTRTVLQKLLCFYDIVMMKERPPIWILELNYVWVLTGRGLAARQVRRFPVSPGKRRLEGADQKTGLGLFLLDPGSVPPSSKTATTAFCIHAAPSGPGLVGLRVLLQQDNDPKHT